MRGDLIVAASISRFIFGSSPLARRTLGARVSGHINPRFIPACAANSLFIRSIARGMAVHPRLRGELTSNTDRRVKECGSSPLARRTPRPWIPALGHKRFIPACAANSSAKDIRAGSHAVHPRLRGELFHVRKLRTFAAGSSPLARRTPRG